MKEADENVNSDPNDTTYFMEQNTTLNDSDINQALPTRFLDTIKLNALNISYQRIDSDKYSDKWLLKARDTMPKSNEIKAVTCQIVAKTHDNNGRVFFQLDSLIIQLPYGQQSFGFNNDGPYFYSYETLQKPDIGFDDYNFDGIIDFSVQSGGSGANEVRYYYIYNSKFRRFNDPIRLANASFDKGKKLVYQSWHLSAAEGGQSIHRFSKSGKLIMLRSENVEYVDSLDSYVKEIKLLGKDGSYSIISDTIKRK